MDYPCSFDEAYIRRLGDGDPVTAEHFARYFGDLIRIKAMSRMRSPDAADDVRQETLMRVILNVRRGVVEQPERFGAYVNAVCNNTILEYLRRNRRMSQMPENQPEPSSDSPNADDEIVLSERRDLVRRAMANLAPKDKEILRRVCIEEDDKDAVCKELEVTRGYLRVLLYRARTRLRAAVEGTGRL